VKILLNTKLHLVSLGYVCPAYVRTKIIKDVSKEEPRMMASNNQNMSKHTLFISVNVIRHAKRTRLHPVSTCYVE